MYSYNLTRFDIRFLKCFAFAPTRLVSFTLLAVRGELLAWPWLGTLVGCGGLSTLPLLSGYFGCRSYFSFRLSTCVVSTLTTEE
jgi:hypothetical protein